MKYVYLILTCMLFGCKQNQPSGAGTSLKVQWEFLGNRMDDQDRWSSRLAIINTSHEPLGNNWELFFSLPSGRMMDSVFLKKNGYHARHWAGGHFSIKPEQEFQEVLPGDTLQIEMQASGSLIKNSDAPLGFYFIFDGNDEQVYLPEVHTKPLGKDVILYKGASRVLRPDPEEWYHQYNSLRSYEKEVLSPVTPEPEQWQFVNGNFLLSTEAVIDHAEGLAREGMLLREWLRERTGLSPALQTGVGEVGGIRLELDEALMPEAYALNISPSGVMLRGGSPAGVFYGIQSLKALLMQENDRFILQGITIKDHPAFSYRGMHLDVARNFSSKESVLKLLDLMAHYKLNTFHFHLTDDEGWRVEIPGLPELTEVGGKRVHTRNEHNGLYHQYGSARTNSGSGFYTREEYMEILRYAAERHIEVIPEIDLPGHARAAIVAMKARERKYLEAGDTVAARTYLLHDAEDRSEYLSVQNFSDNVVNVCMPSTYAFVEKVVDEMQRMHMEAGNALKTLHIGGDEVPNGVWEQSAVCMGMFPEEEDLANSAKQYFVERVKDIMEQRSLRMAGWEEIGLSHGEEGKEINPVPAGTDPPLLYHWNNSSAAGESLGTDLAAAGYPVVLSHVTNLYFDMAYTSDPEEPGFYWGGFVDARKVFEFSFPENLRGIRGIQGQLWSELIDTSDKMEYMIFPKMIAMAERAWKGNTGTDPEEAWGNFASRLGHFELDRLDAYGSGIHYRIPSPGGFVRNDTLYLLAAYPGLELRYEVDGDPDENSTLYTGPVYVQGNVKAAAFRPSGRSGYPVGLPVSPVDPTSFSEKKD